MRKLKVQVQMSIDGFISGPNGEMDWLTLQWDTELKKYVYNLSRPVDTILLGKNLAYSFIESWEKRLHDPSTNDIFTRKMVETPKIVFSKTLDKISWKNSKLAKGELKDELLSLKKMKGRDIIVYGGVSFLSSLISGGYVDEYNLFINPVVLGKGHSMFQNMESRLNLDLVYSTHFDCGITALCYVSKKNHDNATSLTVTTDSAVH